jgi:hypothetical protein
VQPVVVGHLDQETPSLSDIGLPRGTEHALFGWYAEAVRGRDGAAYAQLYVLQARG